MRYKAYFESLDPLREDSTNELKTIDYPKLLFDFKFSEDGKEFKKYDRLDVKGFGFTYENHDYNFITWDVKANKQLYLMSGAGDIPPNGVYFILRSLEGQIPIYSMFWEKEQFRRTYNSSSYSVFKDKESQGFLRKREIIFDHPTRGFLYMSTQYPMIIKRSQLYDYLELEPEFTITLKKREDILSIVKKYNEWKRSKL
jgi:hypothetical protein